MRRLRAWIVRLAGSFGGARRDRDLAAELESHLQMHVDDGVRAGLAPDEARRRAVLALGGLEATKDRYRDRRGLPFFDTLRQDLVYALRTLRKSPSFSAVAIGTLALGIGANTAIFSVVNAALLRPLPFHHPDRLVLVFATDAARGDRYDVTSYPSFLDWRDQNHSFDSMAAFATRALTIAFGTESVVASGKRVTPGFFDVLGVQPAVGRGFRADEDQPGSTSVAILSDAFARHHFGSSAAAIGRALRVNEEPHTIVGVMPPSFHMEQIEHEELYLPLPIEANRGHGFLRVVARLKRGVSVRRAQIDMERIATQQASVYPRQHAGVGASVLPLTAGLARDARFGLYTMLAVVGTVLVIACANVAGLMLARGASRQRELAVRAALGAGRGRLIRQLLVESALVAAAAGAAGMLLANWISQMLVSALVQQFRLLRLDDVRMDGAVFAFTALVSIATGILFGALPAVLSASTDVTDALRDGGRSATGRRAPRLRGALVVMETALALVLLATAGTLLRTFLTLRATHPGFETAHVLAVDLFLPQPRFAQRADRNRFLDDALRRVHALPGVRSAAFVADLPLGGSTDGQGFHIPGRPDPAPDKLFTSGFNVATAGYFELMGIPLRSGRTFTVRDGPDTAPVLVINETAAKTFWPGESPIGREIDLPAGKTSVRFTIVGITGDVRHVGLGTPPRPEMFVDSLQSPLPWPWLVLTVRAHGDPTPLVDSITAAVREADPNVPVQRASTLEHIVSQSIVEPRLYTVLLGSFAALAVLLAAVGLYGLMSYTVSQRTHELGIRVALGAGGGEIVGLVLRRGIGLTAVGALIGLAASVGTTRLLVAVVKEVQPHDAATLAGVTAVLVAAALIACVPPARRAARVDPMIALRAE